MNQRGFQLHIRIRVDGEEQSFIWDNVRAETVERILGRWSWPRWSLVGSLKLINVQSDRLVTLPWKDIVSIQVQPQVEVI